MAAEDIEWIRNRARHERAYGLHQIRQEADRLRRDLGLPSRFHVQIETMKKGFQDMAAAANHAAELMASLRV